MLIPKPISYCFLNCPTTTTTTTTTILLSSSSSSLFNNKFHLIPRNASSSPLTSNTNRRRPRVSTTTTATTSLVVVSSSSNDTNNSINNNNNNNKGKSMECFGTGLDVECLVVPQIDDTQQTDPLLQQSFQTDTNTNNNTSILSLTTTTSNDDDDGAAAASTPPLTLTLSLSLLWDWALLISPFFFWGTAMVAMKQVLPKAGPFFVSTFRLIPAGFLLIAFATSTGRKQPSGTMAWLSISLFALIDATCFQGFLAQGLQRTSAGLGSVIIDSQPLTVAVLATLLFGESIGVVGVAGLVLGVVGLLLLEVPATNLDGNDFSLWGNGEWWMLLAAQSMAVGTVMVRWVSKYSDPVMATGWHMVIGGIPLVVVSVLNHDPAISGSLKELTSNDLLALLYTSVFGSAISYGVYFYNATRGSLTKLSSLTFLTPMFASVFGFLYLGETFSPVQVVGALVTVVSIYLVNYRSSSE